MGVAALRLAVLSVARGGYDHSEYSDRMRSVVRLALDERRDHAEPYLAATWTTRAGEPPAFHWRYAYAGVNSSSHVVEGTATCELSDASTGAVVVAYMKMTSNAAEEAIFREFDAALETRGLRPRDRFRRCFLEPVFATTCARSRRCIPKFMEGVNAKLAFAHDVLARMAPDQLLIFLDTDTVTLKSLQALVDAFPESSDFQHMAEDPRDAHPFANTGVYLTRRNDNAMRYLSVVRALMAHDAAYPGGATYHDQMWANFAFVHLHAEAPVQHGAFPWNLVGAGHGGAVGCSMVVYHAIYTRDYHEKAEWQANAYRGTAACR